MSLMLFIPLELNAQSLEHYIGLRVGTIVPISAKKQAYKPSTMVGVDYSLSGKVIGGGVGLDFFKSSAKEKGIKTRSTLLSAKVRFDLSKQTAKVKPYLMAGANVLIENSEINLPQFGIREKVSNTTLGLKFGAGVKINKLHGGISYIVWPGSENVKGMIALTCGYRFPIGSKK